MTTKIRLLHDTVGIPTGAVAVTQSASDNTTKVATTAYVTTALANLADSAPSTLNTLNELAAALGDDANFSTTVTNSIAAKLPLAGGTLTGDLILGDNVKLEVGSASGGDLQLYHDGTHSYIDNNKGALFIRNNVDDDDNNNIILQAKSGEYSIICDDDGAVTLYHDNAAKLATASGGVTVTGQILADSGTANDAYSATGFNSESQIKIDVASTQNNYAGIQFSHSGNTEGFIGLVRTSTTVADSDFVIQGYSSNKTAYTEYLRISDEGNLGLGTTAPTHSANYHTLDIRGTNGGQFILGREAGGSSNVDFFIYSDSSSANIGTPHELHFETNSNGGQTPKMIIKSDGKVGIGTTSPTQAFEVHPNDDYQAVIGRARIGDLGYDDFAGFGHYDTGSQYALLQYYTGQTFVNASSGQPINFRINNSTKMIVASSGNIGINTNSPDANLHVYGTNPVVRISDDATEGYSTLELRQQNTTTEGFEAMYNSGTGHTHFNNVYSGGHLIFSTATGSFGTTSTNERMRISNTGQFFINSNDGGSGKVTAATTWAGAKFIVRETNGFIDMQSSGDSQTVGYRLGYRENTDLAGYIKYGTGYAQMSIENNYTGSNSQNEYSTIYFKNKNASNTLYSRMRIGGGNGYISTNPIGNAAQTSHQFEVQGGTAGTIFLSNNLAGYTVGQYPVVGTSGGDLHFQANSTYTGYISYNSGFTDVSDEREKENITTISNATSKLKQLRGVTHTWKDNRDDGATHLGLIAQEVKAVVPEVVSEGPTKPDETEPTLGVHYGKLVPLLIETIKELEARIATLEG